MAVGPGKYAALVTGLREELEADVIMLVVVGGKRGSGFEVQATQEQLKKLVPLLEEVVGHMKQDLEEVQP